MQSVVTQRSSPGLRVQGFDWGQSDKCAVPTWLTVATPLSSTRCHTESLWSGDLGLQNHSFRGSADPPKLAGARPEDSLPSGCTGCEQPSLLSPLPFTVALGGWALSPSVVCVRLRHVVRYAFHRGAVFIQRAPHGPCAQPLLPDTWAVSSCRLLGITLQ